MKLKNYFLSLIYFTTIVFIFYSCDRDGHNCTDASITFKWIENRNISESLDSIIMDGNVIYITEYNTTNGQSNLFEYKIKGAFCEDIIDSGGTQTFSMMIPADSTESFIFIDEQIIETSAFLDATFLYPPHSVEEGVILGEKIDDDHWRISIDIITKPQEYEGGFEAEQIILDELFTLQ